MALQKVKTIYPKMYGAVENILYKSLYLYISRCYAMFYLAVKVPFSRSPTYIHVFQSKMV
nr:MAG TPA: hypothetical protein [Caudoviricetes sp.]